MVSCTCVLYRHAYKKVLDTVGISWEWLNNMIVSAKKMEINSNDNRDWIFSLFWWLDFAVKAAICRLPNVPDNILTAIKL